MDQDDLYGFNDGDLNPAQRADMRALHAAAEVEFDRTAVDWRQAMLQLSLAGAFSVPMDAADTPENVFVYTRDGASAIVATLRTLPDAAGTEAFVAAHKRRTAGGDSGAI